MKVGIGLHHLKLSQCLERKQHLAAIRSLLIS